MTVPVPNILPTMLTATTDPSTISSADASALALALSDDNQEDNGLTNKDTEWLFIIDWLSIKSNYHSVLGAQKTKVGQKQLSPRAWNLFAQAFNRRCGTDVSGESMRLHV